LAGELARADFSGESRIRESLRERLAGRRFGLAAALRSLFVNNYARAAFAAAALVIALLPLARRQPAPPPGAALPQAAPQLTAELPPLPPLPRARLSAGARAPQGELFAALPMGRLQSQLLKEFPIAPAGSGLPMALSEGRPIPQNSAGGIVLQTESAPFPIQHRPVLPEGIFERRTL
jgi:hypothetical protein